MALDIHAFVQNAHDLDYAWFEGAVKNNVNRIGDRRFAARKATMANMKAANSAAEIATIDR